MLKNCFTLFAFVFLFQCISFSQQDNFRFRRQLEKAPLTPIAFSVTNTPGTLERLLADKAIRVKSVTPEWIFIQASPQWIADAQRNGTIASFYFEHSIPMALNDSSLVKHHVTEVHGGLGGLPTAYTGKDVIIGYVDQGIDYNHPDFIDANGDTRVLYYWDHTLPFDANRTPMPYGYGQLWYASDINNGTCGSNEEATAHGTSVAGAGSSNGFGNGKEKGVAPDSKIIVVETNFDLPNWTLTIADACDFIFKKADSLGLPAVVNLSLGSYLGSHDGNDPAAILMEQLLDEHAGRIIVCAAGNSGAWGKYHVHGEPDANTSFTWFRNNPSGALGANTIYFDVWADVGAADWTYALAANLNSGSYAERATTIFRTAGLGAGTVIYDTLYNSNGNRLATIELYPAIEGTNLHLEVYFSHVDSTTYNYAFKTTGSGSYDLWSGATLGLNTIVETLPSSAVYPPIVHYNLPDASQTVVSSWNCSEKVISVGNLRNRYGHTDKNGAYYTPAPSYTAAVGELSPNSSKGPSRHGVTKPDVSACGDVSLSAGPMWIFLNPGLNSVIDEDNLHVRNGGTSMASPLVAGMAALYLEKCSQGTYGDFKTHLLGTAESDGFTGAVPNNAYGYGKPNALELLLATNFSVTLDGPTQYCGTDTAYATGSVALDSVWWNNGTIGDFNPVSASGPLYFIAYDAEHCVTYSDTLTLTMGDIPPTPVITVNGTILSTADYPDLQWYSNGTPIGGATNDTLIITLPNSNWYTVVATGTTGCEAISQPYNASAGIDENGQATVYAYPNPTTGVVTVVSDIAIDAAKVYDLQGNSVKELSDFDQTIDLRSCAPGTYFVRLSTEKGALWMKIVRN